MLKETKKIVWLGGLALLVLVIIAIFTFSPSSKANTPKLDVTVDKNTNIVTDGEYIFFNNPDGDVMMMHAFETTPELWIEGDWKVLSVSENNMVFKQNEDTIAVFNREEKGLEETYAVKTDIAYCTKGAVYYRDMETGCIRQIDRKTKEDVVFLGISVNDFQVVGDKLIVAQGGDKKGIALFDYSAGGASLYLPEQVAKTVSFSDNMIAYTDKKDKVRRLNLGNGNDISVKKVKADSMCFSKGVYFYVEKKLFGGYKLGINDSDAFR